MKESNQVFVRQKQLHKKLKVTIALSGLVVLAMVVVTTMLGEAAIGFGEVLSVVTGKVFGNTDMLTDLSGGLIAIVWDIRLPRILTGIFVGAGLAMSGTVFSSTTNESFGRSLYNRHLNGGSPRCHHCYICISDYSSSKCGYTTSRFCWSNDYTPPCPKDCR